MTPRQRNAMVRKIIEHLRPMVAGRADPDSVAPRVGIELPPLLTTEEFEGTRLTDLMVPSVPASDEVVEECFAYLMFKVLKPELAAEAPDANLPAAVQKFVGESPERFLVWAGRQPGWSLLVALDQESQSDSYPTLVAATDTVAIGVRRGELLCRYREYLDGARFTPSARGITEPMKYLSKDKAVTLMWGRISPGSRERVLLGAARYAHQHSFSALAPWLFAAKLVTDQQVIQALVPNKRPFERLCDLLVPDTLDRRTFYRTFGCPVRWAEDPPEFVRERAYLKLKHLGVIE